MTTTLIEYSREIVPMFIALNEKKTTLKEWAAEDAVMQKMADDIKALQDAAKEYMEKVESTLVREIKDLETDIKEAVKGAARGANYKPAELKGFFAARAKDSVEKVVDKGEMFAELEKGLA